MFWRDDFENWFSFPLSFLVWKWPTQGDTLLLHWGNVEVDNGLNRNRLMKLPESIPCTVILTSTPHFSSPPFLSSEGFNSRRRPFILFHRRKWGDMKNWLRVNCSSGCARGLPHIRRKRGMLMWNWWVLDNKDFYTLSRPRPAPIISVPFLL